MATILYIETATQVCSVALSEDGKLLHFRESREKNIHSSIITVFIDEVIRLSGRTYSAIDAVAVSKGPGSYTGLRIGVSTAKGICYALDKPLISLGTLESMAEGMLAWIESRMEPGALSPSSLLCPLIDARRMEAYSALFDVKLNQVREIQAEIITEESFSHFFPDHVIWFGGDGSDKCRPLLGHLPHAKFIEDFVPSAIHMIKKAESKFIREDFENLAYFEPFYLKDFIPGIPKVKGLRTV